MGKVVAGMTVSLDGYMNDRTGSAESLSPDFDMLLASPVFKKMIADTGAVIMGRNTYQMADPFLWVNDDYEFQVPLFVMTHVPPGIFPAGNEKLSVTFVTDGIASAVEQAKRASGGKMVQVIGGADVIQQCLNAGLCDELQVDIMPVFLGGGLRLFENLDTEHIRLERLTVEEPTPMRTSITYRVTMMDREA